MIPLPACKLIRPLAATAALAVLPLLEQPVRACSVCYGDPQSSMVQGAFMGVVVLIVIVGSVLVGIAGFGVYWLQRSRKFLAEHPEWRLDAADV